MNNRRLQGTALLIGTGLLVSGLWNCGLAATADAGITYIEMAKPVEPLEAKKAFELATAFFEKKYWNNPKNYFIQKMEYGEYDNSPHTYGWEIYITAKPGHAIVLGDPFSVTLIVGADGKVSLEKEVSTWGNGK